MHCNLATLYYPYLIKHYIRDISPAYDLPTAHFPFSGTRNIWYLDHHFLCACVCELVETYLYDIWYERYTIIDYLNLVLKFP
jgi:hypothetical protein